MTEKDIPLPPPPPEGLEPQNNTPPPPPPWDNSGFSSPTIPNEGILYAARTSWYTTLQGYTVRNISLYFSTKHLAPHFGPEVYDRFNIAVLPIERRTKYFHKWYLRGEQPVNPWGRELMPFLTDNDTAYYRHGWVFSPIFAKGGTAANQTIHFDIELVPSDHRHRRTLDAQIRIDPGMQAGNVPIVPRVVPR